MGKTLLLADDSVTIQKVVGISFASEDIAITTVDNGDDAIAKARELRPDVILADVVMPGKSGYEVCEAVKADPSLQHIPVLLLTGTFEAFDEARASTAGAAGHVAKPFEAQTLVERVKDLLSQPAATVTEAPPAAAPASPEPLAAAPAPAAAEADNAFDFFDDPPQAAQSASMAPVAAPPAPSQPEPARPDLEIESPDAAFAFGDDELDEPSTEVVEPTPAAVPPPAAHTVAILPDDPAPSFGSDAHALGSSAPSFPAEAPSFEASAPGPLQPPAASEPAAPPALPSTPPPVPAESAPAPASPEGFDFEFEGPAAANTPSEAPQAAVAESQLLDPEGDSAFDVSSSELGDLVADVPPAPAQAPEAATQLLETPFPGAEAALGGEPSPPSPVESSPIDLGSDPVMDMLSNDPVDSGPVAPSPGFVEEAPTAAPRRNDPLEVSGASFAPPAPPTPEPELAPAEPEPITATPEPVPFDEPDPVETPAPEPFASDAPVDVPAPESETVLADVSVPFAAEEAPESVEDDAHDHDAAAALPDDALEQIAPALQEQLHETLERIAWEAFGQVTETVVEQAVERLEKIAWEVVPKLAETLIQEEIRKLKGE